LTSNVKRICVKARKNAPALLWSTRRSNWCDVGAKPDRAHGGRSREGPKSNGVPLLPNSGVMDITPSLESVEAAVKGMTFQDAQERPASLLALFHPIVVTNESEYRQALHVYLDRSDTWNQIGLPQ
jgi:hypothetical protein